MDSRRWHDWCTCSGPVEPPPLTVEQWNALDDVTRISHIDQLRRWLHQYYFATAQFDYVAEGLNTIVDRNAQTPPGAKEIAVITGPNTIGKSAFIKDWARQRYLEWTAPADVGAAGRPVWYPTPDIECDFFPVWFINLQDDARKKALDSQVLEFCGLPSGITAQDTTRSAMKAVVRHRARVVVIDDVNLLKTEWAGARQVLDHIKFLNTELGESGASLVLVGANLIGGELLNDPQINGRSKTFAVAQYEIDEPDEQRAWQRVVRDIEKRLLPHLPAGRAGMLYRDLAGELWFRTQGYFQDLKQLICEATIAATDDGTHMIVRDHLDAVTLSDRAETRRHEMMDRDGLLKRAASNASTTAGTPAGTDVTSSSKHRKAHRSEQPANSSRNNDPKPAAVAGTSRSQHSP
jgi:Bacterial TniB protein